MPGEQEAVALICKQCTTAMVLCAFCEREQCPRPICYRCLRIQLGQSMAHPHRHGG